MADPLSLEQVYAAAKKLMPPEFLSEDDTSDVLGELRASSAALAMAKDIADLLLDEFFPDTTSRNMQRWEELLRLPVRPGDDLEVRRARVSATVARKGGYTPAKIITALAPLFELGTGDVVLLEALATQIRDALTVSSKTGLGIVLPFDGPRLGKPWPGNVDDWGVAVRIHMSAWFGPDDTTVTLTGPDGTTWTFANTRASDAWYRTRTAFLGKAAGGVWKLHIEGTGIFDSWELLVSNDQDATQIYELYAARDPELAGSGQIVAAQRLLRRLAMAHLDRTVCERTACIVDDDHSFCDRDPAGV